MTITRRFSSVLLICILAFAFFTRMYRLEQPQRYIFDEVYHAVTAKLIAKNDPRAYEWWNPAPEENTAVDWLHPPLAKYTQAFFIKVFGENTFAWRLSSVLFGVLVILTTYRLAQSLFKDESLSLLAAGLAALDGLLLVQSRIAMNDIHVTLFILLTALWYARLREAREKHPELVKRFTILTGIAAGLAVGSKWSGAYAIAGIGIAEACYFLPQWWHALKAKKRKSWPLTQTLFSFIILVSLPVIIYVLSYSHMFLQGKNWQHFHDLHQQIWWYQTNLKATHGYQSRPWEWFLDLRPVWYHVDYSQPGKTANIYAFGNPALFWLGAIAVCVTLAHLALQVARRRLPFALTFLTLMYFIVWLPWELSPRIMFFYHYTPAVPLMCIILAYWLRKMWQEKIDGFQWQRVSVIWLVFVIALAFGIWYPDWTGIHVPQQFANTFYFALRSWK